MQRLFAMFLCMGIAFACGTPVSSAGVIEISSEPRAVLESLNNDECIAFLEKYGVEVPYFFADAGGTAVRDVVMEYLENPNKVYAVGLVEASNFYDGVKSAIKKYTSYSFRPKPYAESMYAL